MLVAWVAWASQVLGFSAADPGLARPVHASYNPLRGYTARLDSVVDAVSPAVLPFIYTSSSPIPCRMHNEHRKGRAITGARVQACRFVVYHVVLFLRLLFCFFARRR